MDPALVAVVADSLGSAVANSHPIRGGDVAMAYAVDLANGHRVFVKSHPRAPAFFFTTEAAGLRWVREGAAGDRVLAVPEVLAVSDTAPNHLVLEWIEETGTRRGDPIGERQFGIGLARLHAAGAPCFGREDRRTTGSLGLPNEPAPSWPEFYAANRLIPLARLARDGDTLPAAAIDGLGRIASRLADFGGADEPAARLHGDLWAGNRLVDRSGRHWLVDPAAHGGHREFDLAMMRLFGGFGRESFAAYEEESPLTAGWEARVALHQIAPLVVHAIKFGGGYVASATDAIAQYS